MDRKSAQLPLWRRVAQTLGAVRTGIILLIVTGLVSAAGTVIQQRPTTDPDELQRAYSPQVLRVLDALQLTDVYHSWYFLALMALLAISIIFASLERWPNAWRYYSRPYRRTDSSFRAVLPLQRSYPIADPAHALATAESVLRRQGLRPERIVENDEVSLYAEKSRFAVMAVYVVHASLLLILLGGIVDGLRGYRGSVSLVPGQPAIEQIQLRDGSMRRLPFQLRCDAAGQENYTGEFAMMPKRWWSKLTVLENGSEVTQKEIAVNEPLTWRGVRFYQSGYGQSGVLESARVAMVNHGNMAEPMVAELRMNAASAFTDSSSLTLLKFFPDAYSMEGGIYQRSRDLGQSAAQVLYTAKDGKTQEVWLYRTERAGPNDVVLTGPYDASGNLVSAIPYRFVAYMKMAPYTGLSVSHEPGQWAVWSGCLLLGAGLLLAFWVLHQRYWIVPVTNKDGQLVLWFGAAARKNRDAFEQRFRELADEIGKELDGAEKASAARG